MRACHIFGIQLTVLVIANCLLVSGLQLLEAAGGCHLWEGSSWLHKTPAAAASIARNADTVDFGAGDYPETVGGFQPTPDFNILPPACGKQRLKNESLNIGPCPVDNRKIDHSLEFSKLSQIK